MDDDDDTFDHESFLENMMAEMRKKNDQTEEDQLRQKAKDMEEKLEQERKLEEQKFADNNFWRIGDQPDNLNVEDLLGELDDDVPQSAAPATSESEPKVEISEPEETKVDSAFVEGFLDAFEDDALELVARKVFFSLFFSFISLFQKIFVDPYDVDTVDSPKLEQPTR